MRAILIDTLAQAITEVDYDGNYKSIYGLIGCGTFDVVGGINKADDSIFVDDNGLLYDPQPPMFSIQTVDMPKPITLAGKGLILGTDDEGNSIAPTMTLDDAKAAIKWMAEGTHIEPVITITSFDPKDL